MNKGTADRKERERDFHNDRFSEETRSAQGKYYFALSNCRDVYERKIEDALRGKHTLEYGCSFGTNSLKHASTAKSIVGIDISDIAIDRAKHSAEVAGIENVEFIAMDAENMTFEKDTFECVFGSGIIHHLDLEKCYSEICRVMKNDGKAIFVEPLGSNFLINIYRFFTPGVRTPDEHPLKRKDIELAKKYFKEVSCEFFGLSTLATVPFRNFGFGRSLFSAASSLDSFLFKIKWLRWQAWFIVLTMQK